MFGWAGTTSERTGNYYEQTQLLFPVKHKNYHQESFFKKQWESFQAHLDKEKCNTHRVSIFGYSAPVSDVEALGMMKEAWGDRDLEQFVIIGIRKEEDVRESWSEFIHTHHYDYTTNSFESSLARYPRRTDEALFCQYLPTTPVAAFVEPNPVPTNVQTFEEMWEWYQPLIDKESK